MTQQLQKPTLVIAGPGAGKTHNMVSKILASLADLKPSRYMAVITYTNSATNNIVNRLSKKTKLPDNVFIGTIHSFLNRFIVIPFSSFNADPVGAEKLFMQCGLEDIYLHLEKDLPKEKRCKTIEDKSAKLKRIKDALNRRGYITFDQTLSLASACMDNKKICQILANRLQYLFVDEFQDSGNAVFNIIEAIRKKGKTQIYCVGDPEQYIQSFDSSIRSFTNIPILKAATNNCYSVEINDANFRCSKNITTFLNNFNGRIFGGTKFQQRSLDKASLKEKTEHGSDIYFLPPSSTVTHILQIFYKICEDLSISIDDRCVIAKTNKVIDRIIAASSNHYKNPKKSKSTSPLKSIQDTLLTTLQKSSSEFYKENGANVNTLRKYAIAIAKAIHSGRINDENSYASFVQDQLGLTIVKGLPVKVENLTFDINRNLDAKAMTISNIHTIKGLEAKAVLVIAKSNEELDLWLQTDHAIRDIKRTAETTDYPRLGYVAFSRAEELLCIGCLETVSSHTTAKLQQLGVRLYSS